MNTIFNFFKKDLIIEHSISSLSKAHQDEYLKFYKLFTELTLKRDQRSDTVEYNDGTITSWRPLWNVFEIEQLTVHINKIRSKNNLIPIQSSVLFRIDSYQAGHSDYFRKMCFYGSKLTLENSDSVLKYMYA